MVDEKTHEMQKYETSIERDGGIKTRWECKYCREEKRLVQEDDPCPQHPGNIDVGFTDFIDSFMDR